MSNKGSQITFEEIDFYLYYGCKLTIIELSMKICNLLTQIILFIFSVTIVNGQNKCEQISNVSIENLVPLLLKNDFLRINSTLNTIEASCGENEFTLRTRLVYQIINKAESADLYKKYIKNKFDEQLITRWDDSNNADYKNIYLKNSKKYNYIPLRNSCDSLLKIKSSAILNSNSYDQINENEVAILQLFSGDIDGYLDWKEDKQIAEKTAKKRESYNSHHDKHTFGVHSGLFIPIGENYFFGNSFTGGLSFMSSFANDFVFDLHYKFRIHSSAPAFDFVYKENIHEVESNSSHVLSIGAGYKLLDRNKFIILPKINLGYGIIWTGLSETVYGEDEDGNETEHIRFRNVQTLHSTFGVAIMRHIRNKTYIGVESNVHLIPYKWDGNLKTPIPSKYTSFEFFVRF